MAVKNSYFPDEEYCFGDDRNENLPVFTEMLKSSGCYIGPDGHIRSRKGTPKAKLMRNGYYMVTAQYNTKSYYYMEHRVVWCWHNGPIPAGLEVNHKDYNRGNNRIENLELLTSKENTEYSRPNFKPCRGEKSPKAALTNDEASAIKTILALCGKDAEFVSAITKVPICTINRIKNGKRYLDAVPFDNILKAYPLIVNFTRNRNISPIEELKDYLLGLNGEVGELTDIVKKVLYHGKEYDPIDLMLELGDVLYYITAIALVLGIDMGEVMINNNAKLLARYPNGFSHEASNSRIEEMQALYNGIDMATETNRRRAKSSDNR